MFVWIKSYNLPQRYNQILLVSQDFYRQSKSTCRYDVLVKIFVSVPLLCAQVVLVKMSIKVSVVTRKAF